MAGQSLVGGMIGAGVWSERQLQAWRGVAGASIVALCDRDQQRLEARAAQFEIEHRFAEPEAMLEALDLDFVDVCTRPASHAALSRHAADRGLPVLCQKPFCTSLAQAEATVRYCEAAGARLMINENFRWQSWYRQIAALLAAGAIGEPFLARIHWRLRITLPRFHHPQTYFRQMPRLAVYELGVHYIDVCRFLFGDPDAVYARLLHISPEVAGEDVEVIVLSYAARPLTCLIDHSWASVALPGIDRPQGDYQPWEIAHPMEIEGTGGTLALRHDRSLTLYTDDVVQTWTFPEDTRFRSQVATQQHFVDCLNSGREFETDGRNTLQTMQVVYACYESADANQVVSVGQLRKTG